MQIENTSIDTSKDAQGFFAGGKYEYTKKMNVNAKYAYLNFDGIYKNAKVYTNDELKISVPYVYSPFIIEFGEIKKDDALKVECDNSDQPDSRGYAGAGIYLDVHLYISDVNYIYPNGVK